MVQQYTPEQQKKLTIMWAAAVIFTLGGLLTFNPILLIIGLGLMYYIKKKCEEWFQPGHLLSPKGPASVLYDSEAEEVFKICRDFFANETVGFGDSWRVKTADTQELKIVADLTFSDDYWFVRQKGTENFGSYMGMANKSPKYGWDSQRLKRMVRVTIQLEETGDGTLVEQKWGYMAEMATGETPRPPSAVARPNVVPETVMKVITTFDQELREKLGSGAVRGDGELLVDLQAKAG